MRSEELTSGVCSHHVSHILGNHVRQEQPCCPIAFSVHRFAFDLPSPIVQIRVLFKCAKAQYQEPVNSAGERYSGNPMEWLATGQDGF